MKRHESGQSLFPTMTDLTAANVHHSKGAERMVACVLSDFKQITLIKADIGYRGAFKGKHEQYLYTARYMILLAMISFMLRYFA